MIARYLRCLVVLACIVSVCGCKTTEQLTVCNSDADCDPDEACLLDICRKVECKSDHDCPEAQYCHEHSCVDVVPCHQEEDCQPLEICVSRVCVQVECKDASSCPAGQKCLDHTCVDYSWCRDDGDCPHERSCYIEAGEYGFCVQSCHRDEECSSGFCHPDKLYCAECVDDSQCYLQGEHCIDYECKQPVDTCDLRIAPLGPIDFGNLGACIPKHKTIEISNVGAAECTISSIELRLATGHTGDFSITSNLHFPLALDPIGGAHSTEQVVVTFCPGEQEQHLVTFWISSNDPDLAIGHQEPECQSAGPVEPGQACIVLTGSSIPTGLIATPLGLDFGEFGVGCKSTPQIITIENQGEAVGLAGMNFSDPAEDIHYSIYGVSFPRTIEAGETFEISVSFRPETLGSHDTWMIFTLFPLPTGDFFTFELPVYAVGIEPSEVTDTFHVPGPFEVDILWVVDNSASMVDQQAVLTENLTNYLAWLLTIEELDFQLGVITTQMEVDTEPQGQPPREITPGVLVSAPGRPKILTRATQDLEAAFLDNASVGAAQPDGLEAGLEAVRMALSPPLVDDPTANQGFLRDTEARLHVIFLSDGEDHSPDTVLAFLDFLRNLKSRSTVYRIYSVCGTAPDGCQGPGGSAEAGNRYLEAARLSGGESTSICADDWEHGLRNLGMYDFHSMREYPLSRPALESSVAVDVNGQPAPEASSPGSTDGWTFYSDTNSVYFGDDVIPGYGATIEIHYAGCW